MGGLFNGSFDGGGQEVKLDPLSTTFWDLVGHTNMLS